jgi:hypothetical protein
MTEVVKAPAPAQRKGREGGRWINERPTSQEFSEWFTTSMKIDPKLNVQDYIGGVVLIPGVDNKAKFVVGFTERGVPIIDEHAELSYVPYAKVETRTAYYWDLLEAHPEWVGVVEHVPLHRPPVDGVAKALEAIFIAEGFPPEKITELLALMRPGGLATMVDQLPEGYSITSIPVREGFTHFLCCTIRVSIFKANEDGEPKGRALRTGRGTKQVPLLTGAHSNPWADPNSLMKAETGALGRALGFAGIFVIPGSGVATAEDMLEAIAQGQPPVDTAPEGNAGPAAPPDAPVRTPVELAVADEDAMRERALALHKTLRERSDALAGEFATWANGRRLKRLSEAEGAVLRGALKKLEKLVDQTRQPALPVEKLDQTQQPAVETPNPTEEGSDDDSSGEAG